MSNKNKNVDEELRLAENNLIKEELLDKPLGRKNRMRMIVYLVIIAAAAVSFFAVVLALFFKINTITVKGNTRYTDEEIKAAISLKTGGSLYAFDADSLEDEICSLFPYIKSADVTRKLPSTVIINVKEEKARFRIDVKNNTYLLSEDFDVLEMAYSEDALPLKTGYVRECVVGEKLSFNEEKLLTSLDELWQMLELYELTDKVDYIEAPNRFDICFGYEGRLRVYFGGVDDCEDKIRFFIKIMEHLYDDYTGTLDISDKKEAVFSPSGEN